MSSENPSNRFSKLSEDVSTGDDITPKENEVHIVEGHKYSYIPDPQHSRYYVGASDTTASPHEGHKAHLPADTRSEGMEKEQKPPQERK